MNEKELVTKIGDMFIPCIPELKKAKKIVAEVQATDWIYGQSFYYNKNLNTLKVKVLLTNVKHVLMVLGKDTTEIDKLMDETKNMDRINISDLDKRIWQAIKDKNYKN